MANPFVNSNYPNAGSLTVRKHFSNLTLLRLLSIRQQWRRWVGWCSSIQGVVGRTGGCLLLAFVLVFSFAACGEENKTPIDPPEPSKWDFFVGEWMWDTSVIGSTIAPPPQYWDNSEELILKLTFDASGKAEVFISPTTYNWWPSLGQKSLFRTNWDYQISDDLEPIQWDSVYTYKDNGSGYNYPIPTHSLSINTFVSNTTWYPLPVKVLSDTSLVIWCFDVHKYKGSHTGPKPNYVSYFKRIQK